MHIENSANYHKLDTELCCGGDTELCCGGDTELCCGGDTELCCGGDTELCCGGDTELCCGGDTELCCGGDTELCCGGDTELCCGGDTELCCGGDTELCCGGDTELCCGGDTELCCGGLVVLWRYFDMLDQFVRVVTFVICSEIKHPRIGGVLRGVNLLILHALLYRENPFIRLDFHYQKCSTVQCMYVFTMVHLIRTTPQSTIENQLWR